MSSFFLNISTKFYKFRFVGHFMLDAFFPRRCPVCLSVLEPFVLVCESCKKKLHFVRQPFCYRCGKPLLSFEQEYCYDCRRHKKSFERGFAVFLYDKHMQFSMTQFKYHNKREFAKFYISQALYLYQDLFLSLSIDAIIPVPIHKKKKKERGYNQAELLAFALSDALSIPMLSFVLVRSMYTTPQKELSPRERLENLSHVFQVNSDFESDCRFLSTVLLVDDIYTTGATLEACTRVLKQAGVDTVYTLCICIGASSI